MILFNNCHNRPHQEHYKRPDAFFDLDQTGVQGAQVRNLTPGAECVVASWGKAGVVFDHWLFAREEVLPSPEGTNVRVFCGERKKQVVLSLEDARKSIDYGLFFDDRGQFKRTSVVRGH